MEETDKPYPKMLDDFYLSGGSHFFFIDSCKIYELPVNFLTNIPRFTRRS